MSALMIYDSVIHLQAKKSGLPVIKDEINGVTTARPGSIHQPDFV